MRRARQRASGVVAGEVPQVHPPAAAAPPLPPPQPLGLSASSLLLMEQHQPGRRSTRSTCLLSVFTRTRHPYLVCLHLAPRRQRRAHAMGPRCRARAQAAPVTPSARLARCVLPVFGARVLDCRNRRREAHAGRQQ